MIDAEWTEVATDKVLAGLAAYWANPEPDRYSHRIPERIAGSKWDQQIPEGVRNPYWEILRQMPMSFRYSERPEPDSYFFAPGEPKRTLTDRTYLTTAFAWSIPSPGDIAWIRDRLGGRGVVEPGAGSGYWAWQLSQSGVDVVAYEPEAPEYNKYVATKPWFPVLHGDHGDVKHHPDRALLLCWPSYGEPWAAWALSAYTGDQLFYVGEGPGGCCADDEFFCLLDAEWAEAGDSPHHITFSGIHCYLTEYRRKV